MLELTLPFPPSQNHYYRRYRNRVVISEAGRAYRKEIALMMRIGRSKRFNTARVRVGVTLNAPDRRRRDLDNFMKVIFDAITQSGTWDDDSQVDELNIKRGEIIKGGTCVVRIEEIKKRTAKEIRLDDDLQIILEEMK